MTSAPGIVPSVSTPLGGPCAASTRFSYQIRWRTIVNRSISRTLVVDISAVQPERCAIEAWVEAGNSRDVVLSKSVLPCMLTSEAGMIHLDVLRQGECILAVTLRESDEKLLYCQSNLLAKTEFVGGSYDPPRGKTPDEH